MALKLGPFLILEVVSMDINFDEELAELEDTLLVFSSDRDRSISNEEICAALETDDQDKDQVLEKIRNSCGVHDSITFLQLEGLVRERIQLVTELKARA